jgi:carbamate kinase
MKPKTIVVALGGNALLPSNQKPSISSQFHALEKVSRQLVPLFSKKNRVVLTHGNGPQVGNILIQVESALGKAFSVPLEVAVAESQGQLGYMIEKEIQNALQKKGLHRPVVSLLTQVLVNEKDPAFRNPSKPIGPFFSKAKAIKLKQKGFPVMEDSGRGWRRIVPSPQPVEIVEKKAIQELIGKGMLVVCAGGGGIPVIKTEKGLRGIAAVIDKDLASQVLANEIQADELVILTGVKTVYLNYGKKGQQKLSRLTVLEAERLLEQGQFGKGSMQPKIEAAIRFLQKGGKRVLITAPSSLKAALAGKNGTWIEK